jgi:hypothetical protein
MCDLAVVSQVQPDLGTARVTISQHVLSTASIAEFRSAQPPLA